MYNNINAINDFVGVTCGFLIIPIDGNVRENGSSIGAVAEFSCNAGYVLIGASSIFCQPNGNWSSESPVCQGQFLSTKDITYYLSLFSDAINTGKVLPIALSIM